MVEHQLPKLRVAGSSPVSRFSVPLGVIGNTPDSGSGKSRFEPWGGNSVGAAGLAACIVRFGEVGEWLKPTVC